jgi:hypothetical protein
VGRPDIDAFEAMMMHEDCDTGSFLSLACNGEGITEIGKFSKRIGKMIRAFMVRGSLEMEFARKLV